MIGLNTASIDVIDTINHSTDIIPQNATEIANASIIISPPPSNSTQNNSTQTNNDEHSSMMELRFYILSYLLVFFMLMGCMKPSAPHTAHRQYIGEDDEDNEEEERQRQRRNMQRQRRRNERKEKNKMNVEERMKLVDASLITTTITSRDEESGAVLALSSDTTAIPAQTDEEEQNQKQTYLDDYEDDEASCSCMICLEPYLVGDKVSYSKHNALHCRHVFHRECIADWLMRQDDCPCCRTPYIIQSGDDGDGHSTTQQSQCERANEHNERSFDIETGENQSKDKNDTNGVLYIVDGMISNNMYRLFPITDNDKEQQGQISTNNLDTEPTLYPEDDTDQTVEDTTMLRPAERRRSILPRSLFNRSSNSSQQHSAAYTSISISQEDRNGASQHDDDNRNSRMKSTNDRDDRDDNETFVNENYDVEETVDRYRMEDVKLSGHRDDRDSVATVL